MRERAHIFTRQTSRARWTAASASLVTTAVLGAVVYLASSGLPFLASSPTADPIFGSLNGCLIGALRGTRAGFAVSADGTDAAAFGPDGLAWCTRAAFGLPLPRQAMLSGITAASFDFHGKLWLAASSTGAESKLYRWDPNEPGPSLAGGFRAVALAGTLDGVAAVDANGRVVALSPDGSVLGFAQLPAPVTLGARMATNANGSLVSLVAGGGYFVFRSKDVSMVLAEAPCAVRFWWWRPEPFRALVSCTEGEASALDLDVSTGSHRPATAAQPSLLVSGMGIYVRSCEELPCSGPPP